MASTLSQSNYAKFNSLNYNQLFQNPYQYKPASISAETSERLAQAYENTRSPRFEAPVNEKRSVLDRTLDALSVFNYTLAGGINNLVDDDPDTGFWRGVTDGLKASNPFGKGYEPGEVTYSKVLDTMGWEAESGLEKFARGVVGFGLDVALDPTTYLGGVGLLVKGTGAVGQSAKAVGNLVKDFNVPASMLNASGKLEKMTPEVAEYVLKNSERAESLAKLNAEDYAGTIEQFTRNYNRALGLRETGEITLGLRNVPFGDAIVDKVLGKDRMGGFRLAKSNKGLAMIGKYSGASHVYGATRNFLMGRQIVQKLSTTAKYNVLAKTNPVALYDAIAFARSTKGQQKSIRRATQEAISRASVMSKLTPAEQKAVIELVEDPANWKLVNQVMDEAEVKTYDELRSSMAKDLEELLERRQTMEDTYEAVVTDLSQKMATHKDDVARQLRERGEIDATIREKEYEINWINAERTRKLAELEEADMKAFDSVEQLEEMRHAIKTEYDGELVRLMQEQDDINRQLDDTINSLAQERALEIQKGDFEIIEASKELIDAELEELGSQFAKYQAGLEDALAKQEITFAEAQAVRNELSAQLAEEAKRIYSRQYYQVKKSKQTTAELKEAETALAEAEKALAKLKEEGASGATREERMRLESTISELRNERNRVLSQISEMQTHERVQAKIRETVSTEKFLEEYLTKSFSVGTRFDGMEFEEIRSMIGEQYRKAFAETLLNEDAKKFAQMEVSEIQKAIDDAKVSGKYTPDEIADLEKSIRNPGDLVSSKIDREQLNTLRSMLSELLVGSNSYLHLHAKDAMKLAEYIAYDVNDVSGLTKFFEGTGDLFISSVKKVDKGAKADFRTKKLDGVSAEYLANLTKAVGHIPVMRELLTDNLGRLSGLDGQFYKYMGQKLGYDDYFNDVHLKIGRLTELRQQREDTYNKAMEVLQSFDPMTDNAKTVLQRVAQETNLDYFRLYEDTSLTRLDTEETYDEFADALSEAVMNQMDDYQKIVNELDRLHVIRQVREEEKNYFLRLDHVEKQSYIESVTDEKKLADFIQSMFNKEFDRARTARLEEWENDPMIRGRAPSDDSMERFSSNFAGGSSELNLGAGRQYSYQEALQSTPSADVRNLFYGRFVTETYENMPEALRTRVRQLSDEANELMAPTDRATVTLRHLVSNDKEGMASFISNVLTGRLQTIDVDAMYKAIDNQLAKQSKGMDKRTKAYREMKKKTEDMRRAVDHKARILSDTKKGRSVLAQLNQKELGKYLESLGVDALTRIDETRAELFKLGESVAKSGQTTKTSAIYKELAQRIETSASEVKALQEALDASYITPDVAKKEFGKKESAEQAQARADKHKAKVKEASDKMLKQLNAKLLAHEELLTLQQVLNFGNKFDDGKSFLSVFTSTLRGMKERYYGLRSARREMIANSGAVKAVIRNEEYDVNSVLGGVERLVPHLMQGKHPGLLWHDLKRQQQMALISDAFNIIRKDFDGQPPATIDEMLTQMGEKSLDEVQKRDMQKAYDKLIRTVSDNTYITYLTEDGTIGIGRLVNGDELPKDMPQNVMLKVESVSRQTGNARETVKVPLDRMIRHTQDTLAPVFNTVDKNVEKELIELRTQIQGFEKELAERVAKAETDVPELKKQAEEIRATMDNMYKQRESLTRGYYAKLGEMEALLQGIRANVDQLRTKEGEAQNLSEDLLAKYYETKSASYIAKFDEADPFATAVPGTPEWDELTKEIIERDEDLKALLPSYEQAQKTLADWEGVEAKWKEQGGEGKKKDLYTSDVNPTKVREAKDLTKQFDGLVKQKALGFANGDGFLYFREKAELLDEWYKVRDELEQKRAELTDIQTKMSEEIKSRKDAVAESAKKEADLEEQGAKLQGRSDEIDAEFDTRKNNYEEKMKAINDEIVQLTWRNDEMSRQYHEYDNLVNKSLDTIHEEVAVLQREHARIAKEAQEASAERMETVARATSSREFLENEMQKLTDEIHRYEEALESNEAMETLLRMNYGDDLAEAVKRKSEGLPAYKFAIEDMNIDENLKKFAVAFKQDMVKFGREEVEIGKLNKEAFEAMIGRYFPRVLSAEGERFFAEKRELLEHIRPLTADYGFNTKFNNHAISRVDELRELGIKEVNDFFENNPEYGVRIFEENLARAYIGRAIKHAELMYDDEYTKIIMDVVGYQPVVKTISSAENRTRIGTREALLRERNELTRVTTQQTEEVTARIKEIDEAMLALKSDAKPKYEFTLKEGYEHVVNFGHLREYIRQLVDLQVRTAKKAGLEVDDNMIGQFEKQAVENLKLDHKVLGDSKLPMTVVEGEALERLHEVGLVRQMSKQIIEDANSARLLQIQRDNNKMLQLYDKFTIWLKAMQTAVMPSFHIRNFQGNLFQNWLAVGAEAFNPKTIKQTMQISRRITDREYLGSLEPLKVIRPDGNVDIIHWQQIVDEAIVHGVINEGFFAKDFDGYAKSSGMLGGGKWDVTSTENFAPIKVGFEIGTVIENQGRLAQFSALLKQGHSFEEASEIVTKYLFDYSDLTHFEKKWMKRIFPYYTWMRKNSVLQIRELMAQPNKYAQVGKLGQSMENSADPDNTIEDKYISNYARDWLVTPFTMKNKDGVEEPVLFSSNLPFKDLASLPFDPFNITDSIRGLIAQTSPVFKKPIESLFNYNIHYDSPIVNENSQNPFTPHVNHMLTELAWYNAVSGFLKQDTAGDKFLSGLNSLGGIKMSSYDYESNMRRTVEKAWEDYYGKSIGAFMNTWQMKVTDAMTWEVYSGLSKQIVKLAGLPPQAGEYTGALAPISEETYNELSPEEQAKYTKPTGAEMGYINKRAQELAEQAYNESGRIKKFGWMMLDEIDVPYKNPIHAVRVTEVTDGDTLKISFGGGTENVRLLLVDTPESKGEYKDNPMAFGQEASDFTKQMVLGKDVKLYLDGVDSYGRMLAFVEREESFVNEELLREGLGKVRYLYERDKDNYDVQRFRAVENEAYQAQKGVWSIPGYATPGDTDFEGGRSSN